MPALPSTFVDPRLAALLRDRSAMPASGADLVTQRPETDPYADTAQGLPTYDTPIGKAVGDSLLMFGEGGKRLARQRTARAMLGDRNAMVPGQVTAVGGSPDAGDDAGESIIDPPQPTDGDPYTMQVWLNQVAQNRKARLASADRATKLSDEAYTRQRRATIDTRSDAEYAANAPSREAAVAEGENKLLRNRRIATTLTEDLDRAHANEIATEEANLEAAQQKVAEAKARIAHLTAQTATEGERAKAVGRLAGAAETRAGAAATTAGAKAASTNTIKIGTRQPAGMSMETGQTLYKVWDGKQWILEDGAATEAPADDGVGAAADALFGGRAP